MIYTVTFNPAVDYVVRTGEMKLGCVNRAVSEQIFFGGKGINVSAVLAELGIRSKALGFTAGFTGEAIENGVKAMGIDADFIRLSCGNSRINVKIRSDMETELNGQGPEITESDTALLFEKLDRLQSGDTLILAGSIPGSLPADIYERILASLSDRDIMTVADASGELLMRLLKYRPYLIKPNNFELGELFDTGIDTPGKAVEYAGRLQQLGAQNVLVSMAEQGAVLLEGSGKVHTCGVCRGTVRNSVGAGDSMLAGFVAGLELYTGEERFSQALRLGTACGGATAFSDGLADREAIYRLLEQLEGGLE
ncbi:MAG: 1-phosphofructokinase [Ruminococcus sp.]|nr:1-phosphofructokinase [Ruminococcus sp.]